MNTRVLLIVIGFVVGLFFISCEKDDTTNPEPLVTLYELGNKNSKIGYLGNKLPIEAEIIAAGKIDVVTIEIHIEGEHESSLNVKHGSWEVDTTFTEFSGLKDTTFNKSIAIPVYAQIGSYDFRLSVTDMDGQQTMVEEGLKIYPLLN